MAEMEAHGDGSEEFSDSLHHLRDAVPDHAAHEEQEVLAALERSAPERPEALGSA